MMDFIEDTIGFGWVIFIVMGLLFGAAIVALVHDDNVREANCERAYAMAHTSRDSLQVMGMCELREQHTTTVVSSPVIIR